MNWCTCPGCHKINLCTPGSPPGKLPNYRNRCSAHSARGKFCGQALTDENGVPLEPTVTEPVTLPDDPPILVRERNAGITKEE